MKKIDRETVQRILDAADIVEVVSDFVSLKKRGVNYIGLCPFHNERTPSFSVSRAKGICKCFSCGKGGSPLNFIMEHEQMTYYEALRYLAKKYNIEVKEREMTDQEKVEASERESMLAVNEFALSYFQDILKNTTDGRDIGLAYFKERGINELMIERFKLGYSLDKPNGLYTAAKEHGFNEKYLLDTGLCSRSDKGSIYDRFRGRVIYPVFSVSGRTIAFGGRTLRNDKTMAKYVNSPESLIYHKSNELYGLYQAKSSIVKQDKCILVEGYMDVISMHQVGIENVVASSGTSLTEGQIRLIHRFTENVTVIYDSDAAGIKASLRGIDMLLAEGLNIKVLLLPEGDDPDSFAQSHSYAEVTDYISRHEVDFIRFKTDILLADAGTDLQRRSKVITEIVKSIACIPDNVTRSLYLSECSRMLDIGEKVLSLQLKKEISERADKAANQERQKANVDNPSQTTGVLRANVIDNDKLIQAERNVIKYIVRYGLLTIAEELDSNLEDEVTVLKYVLYELALDDITFSDKACKKLLEDCQHIAATSWISDQRKKLNELESEKAAELAKGREKIRETAKDTNEINTAENTLIEKCEANFKSKMDEYAANYLSDVLLSSPDDETRKLATLLVNEKYKLSKVHTKYAHVETEQERLRNLVIRSIMELKYELLELQISQLNIEMKQTLNDATRTQELMSKIFKLYQIKSEFSKRLGDRIVNPKN
mgnify:CR=1 FL=1